MITLMTAQCCRAWIVAPRFEIGNCGLCGKRPIVLRALGKFTLRVR